MATIDNMQVENAQGFMDNKVLESILAINGSNVPSDLDVPQLSSVNAAMANDNFVSAHSNLNLQNQAIDKSGPTLAV